MSKINFNLIDRLTQVFDQDVRTITRKNHEYGESWKGEFYSAFENCRRKWDRYYNQAKKNKFDVLGTIKKEHDSNAKDGIIESIRDLRAYLFLIEAELIGELLTKKSPDQLANDEFWKEQDELNHKNNVRLFDKIVSENINKVVTSAPHYSPTYCQDGKDCEFKCSDQQHPFGFDEKIDTLPEQPKKRINLIKNKVFKIWKKGDKLK